MSEMTKLPPLVEEMMARICSERGQPPPEKEARENLMKLREPIALRILSTIYAAPQIAPSFSGYINFLYHKFSNTNTTATSTSLSPQKHTSIFTDDGSPRTKYPWYSPISKPAIGSPWTNNAVPCSTPTATRGSPQTYNAVPCSTSTATTIGSPRTNDAIQCSTSPSSIGSPRTNYTVLSSSSIPEKSRDVLTLLTELEFRKAFLVLSYIGRNKVEDVISVGSALELLKLKDHPMEYFESRVWTIYGQRYLHGEELLNRRKYLDWDSERTHSYYCHVSLNGNISFKGPCLDTTKTHLQRALGDENILIVKFVEEKNESANFAVSSGTCNALYSRIAEEGIVVGLRRYRLLGFKDGGREEKKKNPIASAVKFYFVRMESMAPSDKGKPYVLAGKTLHEARCLFMHLHMTSSMAKYASRFSLILSKTIKLHVDLDSVVVEEIDDIPCRDQNGCPLYDEDELLIHTDGTGYISEDLVMNCPKDFYNAKYIKDKQFETSMGIEKATHVKEPPLLVQCRLFKNGCAVKGTLLVNKKLGVGRIQVRSSMIKVRPDPSIPNEKSFNSLEVVAISHKPRRCTLSKNLIALLSFGGVPKEFFLDLLANALEDARRVFSNKGAALRFLLNHGDRDDVIMATEMITSGVPLDEPVLQSRLSYLASEERKGLQGGKLPISESFYLMGTADPTGTLNHNQVCVILDNGQFSGDVLVYRNPGLHFGDVHVLKATYVEALKVVVGNAKYAIFFSTKGERSMASEIGDGDLDGDMYWVSYNPQLLASYKASPPWKRTYSTPHGLQKKPSEFSFEQLEQELFQQYLLTRKQSNIMGMAADSWLAFMDRLLILGDDSSLEKEHLKKTMLHLVDIYYDALDAAKSGKKVAFPTELKAEKYPHYMERRNEYNSKSVLGLIYDTAKSSDQADTVSAEDIRKLPYFENAEIPDSCLAMWKGRYNDYKREMVDALNCGESKDSCADDVIKRYKQILYGAEDFEASPRKTVDIYNDALALYHAAYDHAKRVQDVKKCLFAWKVAGSALCKFHIMQREGNKNVMVCSFSTLKELMSSKRVV